MTIYNKRIRLRDGNFLNLFFNPENNLLVADKVRRDDLGGNEFIRVCLDDIVLPTKREMES